MSNEKYYDPMYGPIALPSIVNEMIHRNTELARLRNIGMMNFRSMSMLPLTSITRLEHSIGIAHLVALSSEKNRSVAARLNDFLCAALYHDVNCASFGHAVEWAIGRHKPYDHEQLANWVANKDTLASTEDKPIYLGQDCLHRYNYQEKYALDVEFSNGVISGQHTCLLNNTGIDLDNVDNVTRMAFHLGMLDDPDLPTRLARALVLTDDQKQFVVAENDVHLVEKWLSTRSAVYREFIYSREYMAFEYLIFLLIKQYADKHGADEVWHLYHFTDEQLLWHCADRSDKHGEEVSATARRLLRHDLPECYFILRSPQFSRYQEVRSPDFCRKILRDLIIELEKVRGLSPDERRSLAVHVTSDDKKTQRPIAFQVASTGGENTEKVIGSSAQYILLALLGKQELTAAKIDVLSKVSIETLQMHGLTAETVGFSGTTPDSQISLF